MTYTKEDLYQFALKDIKYSMGMAMGNAFQKAVDFYLSDKNINRGFSESDALLVIERLRDMFYSSNQEELSKQIAAWEEFEGKALKEKLGIVDHFENVIIDAEPKVFKPTKKGKDPDEKKETMMNAEFDNKREGFGFETKQYRAIDKEGTKEEIIKEDLKPY